MKLVVNLKLKARVKHTCAKHPRYSPERTGQGGIVGGCPVCGQMYSLYKDKLDLEAAVRAFEDKAAGLSQEGQRNSIAAS
jgi:hypothetical protein